MIQEDSQEESMQRVAPLGGEVKLQKGTKLYEFDESAIRASKDKELELKNA